VNVRLVFYAIWLGNTSSFTEAVERSVCAWCRHDNDTGTEMTTTEELPRIAFPECWGAPPACSSTFAVWLRRARTRRHLQTLEGHRLPDIGVTEMQWRDECAKWFWQK
jgi:uncharacterized protein YjiS (DUF1127 family)